LLLSQATTYTCLGRRHTRRCLQRLRSFQTHTFVPSFPEPFEQITELSNLRPHLLQTRSPVQPSADTNSPANHKSITISASSRPGVNYKRLENAPWSRNEFGVQSGSSRLSPTCYSPTQLQSLHCSYLRSSSLLFIYDERLLLCGCADGLLLGPYFLPSPTNILIACGASTCHCTA